MACTANAQRSTANASLVDELVAIASRIGFRIPGEGDAGVARERPGRRRRIAKIVRAMKELAHPGSRELASVDLARVIQGAVDVSANTRRDLVDIECKLPPLPRIRGYADDLGQVFINIIVNAVQAMEDHPARRGRLAIEAHVDGGDVVITIGDNAGGIPEAARENVFDRSSRPRTSVAAPAKASRSRARSSSIRHGGELTFETETGVGTTFSIRLPIAGPSLRVDVAA